ncbi:unnamed protein product [Amaranthus hypochondriacus]
MADLSSGKDEKNVGRTGSFKIFGKSPARSFSKKNSNPFKRMFSRTKSDKPANNEADAEIDESSSNEDREASAEVAVNNDTNNYVEKMIHEKAGVVVDDVLNVINEATHTIVDKLSDDVKETTQTIVKPAQENATKLVQHLLHQTINTDPLPESINPTPENNEEKKPESFLEKLKGEVQKINEEIKDKAKESGLEEILNKDIPNQNGKALQDDQQSQSTQDEKESQETRSLNTNEATQGDNQENEKQEDNCVTSLAQGLQKICAPWNSKKDD